MKQSVVFAISLAALSVAGCGQKADSAAAEDTAVTSTEASEAAVAPASPAQAFANAAAASDAFEIRSSQLADARAASAKIKSFAQEMIAAHTKSTAKLKTAAAAASIAPDPALTPQQTATLSDLAGRSGADFDRAYASAQVEAHQLALDALKSYSANGEVAPLRDFAKQTIPVVSHHLDMAKDL